VLRGARYDLRKATMIDLIRAAYGVEPDLIVGGPGWLGFDRFDIAAKADPATPAATIRLMLQNLLAERFGLVLHKDYLADARVLSNSGKSQTRAPRIGRCERPGMSVSASARRLRFPSLPQHEDGCVRGTDPYARRRLPREPGY
jgi:Protein of unknown function (DUF3738)